MFEIAVAHLSAAAPSSPLQRRRRQGTAAAALNKTCAAAAPLGTLNMSSNADPGEVRACPPPSNWRLPDHAVAAYQNGIQKFFNWRATPRAVFKKKDRAFLPTRARPPRGSLAFIIVMYSDFFPKECTRVLVQSAAALSRCSNLIVIGNGKKVETEASSSAPAASPFMGCGNAWGMSMTLSPMVTPLPSMQSTPQLPHLSLSPNAELPSISLAPAVKLEVLPAPKKENVLWQGAGSQLPEQFMHSPAFVIKTLDLVFQKSRDLKRRKPLMADEQAVLEPLLPLIETVTRKCKEWTRDAIDLDGVADEQELTRLLTGDKPWSLSITSPYAGLFVLSWRPMEAIVVRTYAVSAKGGPVPVPLASRPSRLHTQLGDRPPLSALLQHLAGYGPAIRNTTLAALLAKGVGCVVHGTTAAQAASQTALSLKKRRRKDSDGQEAAEQ